MPPTRSGDVKQQEMNYDEIKQFWR